MEATPYFSGLKINGYLMKEWTERRNEYKTVIGEERKRYSLPTSREINYVILFVMQSMK